uniref:Luciferin 4-monooxygenase n=1 Tax=Suberites domuncula TaxID=55567 RepID=C7BUE0_SUBDO|nr:luciferase polypeptide [Suberites domuncula]
MHRLSRFCWQFASRSPLSSSHASLQALKPHPISLLYHSTQARSYTFGHTIQPTNIVTSPFPEIEPSPVDFYRHVLQDFSKFGKKIAIVDGISWKEYSFNQIDELTSKFSSGLKRIGFKTGDVLSIVAPNSPEYSVLFFGALASGGVVTTCNPTYTADEICFQFKNSNAKMVATIPALLPTIQEACKGSNIETIIVLDDEPRRARDGLVSYQSLISDSGSLFDPPSIDLHETAVLPYSSGTTGLPKGVMLSHKNIASNVTQMHHSEFFDLYIEGSCLIGVLPFFHIYGMIVIRASSLRYGSRLVTLPKFEPETFLAAFQNHRVNTAPLVPPLVLFLAKHPLVNSYNLSSLDQIMTGAAPVGGETVKATKERVGCRVIRQLYGLTETGPVTHMTPKQQGMTKPDSVGVCLRSVNTKIVSPETGEALPNGEEGELLISGPNVMKGYLNRPDATKECINEDGWFSTGDIGYYDNEGYFYITDRLKELIKVKGLQVAPAEIEALLVLHPKIAEAAVIGLPDERQGESPKAFVVKKDEGVNEKEVVDYIAKKLAVHKHLTGGVEFVDVIPKSASGKILRRMLRDQSK